MDSPRSHWTFVYLGGDSYPACSHAEEALRERLVGPTDRFIGQKEMMEHHADGVWVRVIRRRMTRLQEVLEERGGAPERVVLIGRSAGARVATKLAAAPGGMNRVAAVVCMAYPFRPPDTEPEPDRFAHLAGLRVPTLIFQGHADAWGGRDIARDYALSPAIGLRFLDCDHDMRLPAEGWDAVAREIEALLCRTRPGVLAA